MGIFPMLPTLGLSTSDIVNGSFDFALYSYNFSTSTDVNDDNSAYRDFEYMVIKTTEKLPQVSDIADTLWYIRGCFLISNKFKQNFTDVSDKDIYMEVVDLQRGKLYYDITEGDPESTSISDYTMYHFRSKKGYTDFYGKLQHVRFYLGNPNIQGDYVCLIDYDFT